MSQQLENNKDPQRMKKYLLFIFIIFVTIWSLPIKFLVEEKGYFLTKLPGWPPIPTEIPSEIVKSKDCEAYHKWVHETIHIGSNYKIDRTRCPWDKTEISKIAHFIINGVKLNVPREYITFMADAPDGEIRTLNLAMVYPNMSPTKDAKKEMYDQITILLRTEGEPSYQWCNKSEPKCNADQWAYENLLDLIDKKTFQTRYPFIEEGKVLDNYTTLYLLNDYEFYIQGDYKYPSYWLRCTPYARKRNDAWCESTFSINDKINAKIHMSSTLLKEHLEVRKKTLEKLNEWQQPISTDN